MATTTTVAKEEAFEKQLGGCMAGFFNIFDRPYLLSPKRLSSPPPSSSPLHSGDLKQDSLYSTPELRSPAPDLTPPVTETKEASSRSPWRFSKEAPRLSLDSRAVMDTKGSLKPRQIRHEAAATECSGSPSVIARLMGLEPLPSNAHPLQRSASESRVTRDYRFVDLCKPYSDDAMSVVVDPPDFHVRSCRTQPARVPAPQRFVVRRKSVFDPADVFPEPRQCGGLDAPPSDLETLKQLMEALRLKGLLHSSHKPPSAIANKNLVYESSPIRSRTRAGTSPSASKGRVKSPNRKPVVNKDRRVSPLPWRRPEPVQTNRGGSVEEMWKVEDEYKRQKGKTLLERCDKLLNSIAEMAATEAAAGESQPSPVSVLDYEESSSPSPVMKRTLHFLTGTISEEEWSSDSEYGYISDIIRASEWLPQESDIFSLLEKQQYLKGKCVSREAAQERRLVFDAVQEILGRRRRLPPWTRVGEAAYDEMQLIWSEFQKMRKKRSGEDEDLVEYVCGVLGRDMSDDRWRECEVEMSEAVLDIERLVFKDLIGETIRHLGAVNRSDSLRMRRRLLF